MCEWGLVGKMYGINPVEVLELGFMGEKKGINPPLSSLSLQ